MSATRRTNFWPIVGVLLALLITTLCLVGATACKGQEPGCRFQFNPPAGSALLSVNVNGDNRSIGYLNHCGLCTGNGYVIESQTGLYGNGVLRTPLSVYLSRPYQVWILYPRDLYLGQRAAAIAETFVGRPYRRGSSLLPALLPPIIPRILHGTPYGMNCVSVIRDAYEAALGQPLYGMRTPDDICRRGDLFTNQPPPPIQVPQTLEEELRR